MILFPNLRNFFYRALATVWCPLSRAYSNEYDNNYGLVGTVARSLEESSAKSSKKFHYRLKRNINLKRNFFLLSKIRPCQKKKIMFLLLKFCKNYYLLCQIIIKFVKFYSGIAFATNVLRKNSFSYTLL